MISRREAVRMSAAALAAPSLNAPMTHGAAGASHARSIDPLAVLIQGTDSVDLTYSGPSLDRQIAILWRNNASILTLFGTPPPQNNLLYVPNGTSIMAINLSTGELQWEAATIQDGAQIHQITGELLIVTSQYRVAIGGLQVFNAINGEEIWRLEAGGGGQNTPELFEGTIYIGMSGKSMALTATTGAPVWTVENAQGHSIIQDDTVYVVCHDFVHENGDVLAVDRLSGQVNWRITRPGWQSLQAPSNTFLLVEDNLLFFHGDDTTVQAVDIATGNEVWRYSSDQQIRLQAISSGILYVASHTTLLALRAQDSEELWRFEDGQNISVEPHGSVHLLVSAGPIVYALSAATGTVSWQFTAGLEEVFGSVRADDINVFIAGQNLYGLDAATGSERMRYPLPIDPFMDRARMVIGQGYLFLEYGSEQIFALGNVGGSTLLVDVALRAAPSSTSPERGQASAGEEIEYVGDQSERNGEVWVEATVNGIGGWVPLEAIDLSTIPPAGEVEIIYTP